MQTQSLLLESKTKCSWYGGGSGKQNFKGRILRLKPITESGWCVDNCDSPDMKWDKVHFEKYMLVCGMTLEFGRYGDMVTIKFMRLVGYC